MGTVQTDAVARAMAVLERSATMGVIVAAPTAGSAGVVPGCVLALADHLQLDDEQVMDALYCAAAIGLNLTTSACVAGAEGGCRPRLEALPPWPPPHWSDDGWHARASARCQLHRAEQPVGPRLRPCPAALSGALPKPHNAIGVAAAFSSATTRPRRHQEPGAV